ncbi:hypothetical protein [Chryseobacterium sp. R2A-55]|uniref:hypothetical protein n=1 Tax=Chryseobacterium sp. R2A-55 TaxID=2744445 RepID=UPI001F3D8B67|nr:hypothetical protein [Chryseobacterium sp. R2A-55]
MEAIKNFIIQFLQAEVIATEASVKPDLEDYNNKLEMMNSFCVSELHNKFGMIPLTDLESDEFYERYKNKKSRNPRLIYKISQYEDENYGDVYIAYISGKNPNEMFFLYGECVFINTINRELKIVKNYTFGDDMLLKKKFETPQGLPDISFETLKKPVAIERYQKPEDDDDAMEHYEMDI